MNDCRLDCLTVWFVVWLIDWMTKWFRLNFPFHLFMIYIFLLFLLRALLSLEENSFIWRRMKADGQETSGAKMDIFEWITWNTLRPQNCLLNRRWISNNPFTTVFTRLGTLKRSLQLFCWHAAIYRLWRLVILRFACSSIHKQIRSRWPEVSIDL